MFYINNNPILANDIDVLLELKAQLAINGIDLFATFKQGPSDIQFNCPIHANGQERKPSCGITTVEKRSGNKVTPAGTVHCFTCGYTASLEEMISNCFGYDDMGAFGTQWLIKNFLTVSIENRKDIQLDMARGKIELPENNYITEEELDRYRYYHPYMYKRKLTNEVIELFDIGYDDHFELKDKDGKVKGVLKCITFPVRDINGNTLFIGRRSVTSKVFHYPTGVNKPVYGLYEMPKEVDEIIVVESFFNALTCYIYGKVGVALMGLGTDYQYQQLRRLPCRKFITAFDPDEAGQRATERFKRAMKGRLVTSYVLPPKKDINDLTYDEFINLPEIF